MVDYICLFAFGSNDELSWLAGCRLWLDGHKPYESRHHYLEATSRPHPEVGLLLQDLRPSIG